MNTAFAVDRLTDFQLLAGLHALVARSNYVVAELIAHLAEVDRRKLYLEQACSSLFRYCTERLGFSEHAAYKRIAVARASRRFPVLLQVVSEGRLHLAGICALLPHLTAENHHDLLAAAVGKTQRQVEQLVAARFPKPDVPDSIRRLPRKRISAVEAAGSESRCRSPDRPDSHPGAAVEASCGSDRPDSHTGAAVEASCGRDRADSRAGAAVEASCGRDRPDSRAGAAVEASCGRDRPDSHAGAAVEASCTRDRPDSHVGAAAEPTAANNGQLASEDAGAQPRSNPAAAPARQDEALTLAGCCVGAKYAGADKTGPTGERAAIQARGADQPRAHRSRVEPLSETRYRIQFTASQALKDKLEQAQELLSHVIPGKDLAALFERALDEVIAAEQKRRYCTGSRASRTPKPEPGNGTCATSRVDTQASTRLQAKCGVASQATGGQLLGSSRRGMRRRGNTDGVAPIGQSHDKLAARQVDSRVATAGCRSAAAARASNAQPTSHRGAAARARRSTFEVATRSRYIPAAVRRRVFERDNGQCTYVDPRGRRCSERRYLQFEHRIPFALGGPATVENICLRCSMHNARAAEQVFGRMRIEQQVAARRDKSR